MLSANQCLLLLCKGQKLPVKKYLSVESETLGAKILRRYSNKDFSRTKLNVKIRAGRIFTKLLV